MANSLRRDIEIQQAYISEALSFKDISVAANLIGLGTGVSMHLISLNGNMKCTLTRIWAEEMAIVSLASRLLSCVKMASKQMRCLENRVSRLAVLYIATDERCCYKYRRALL